jgi:hypothetical protein
VIIVAPTNWSSPFVVVVIALENYGVSACPII